MFWKREHIIVKMVDEYLAKAVECLDLFRASMDCYLENGISAAFDEQVDNTHMAESFCDDIRRKIEAQMYEEALIPESRGDILGLIEATDKICNRSEDTLRMIQMQLLVLPEEFADNFRHLASTNHAISLELFKLIKSLLTETDKVQLMVEDIDKRESIGDKVEMDLIKSIFSSEDLAGDQKILLRDLVIRMGKISDQCENVAERVSIIRAKRLM